MTTPTAVRRQTTRSGAPREVAEGVYRLGTKWANLYLVAEDGEFTLVDAGYPGYWKQLVRALATLGASPEAIQGVLVTHHHVDHAGTAARLRALGARVIVGAGDADIVTGRRPSHPPRGFYRQSWRASMLGYLAHSAAAGGAKYRPVASVEILADDHTLDVPGRPRVVQTPGHTAGHYSVALEDRSVLFSGDALVTFDYAAGRRGIAQHRFNEDRHRAFASLARLDAIDADIVLVGHGDPWTGGLRRALEIVREGAPR